MYISIFMHMYVCVCVIRATALDKIYVYLPCKGKKQNKVQLFPKFFNSLNILFFIFY